MRGLEQAIASFFFLESPAADARRLHVLQPDWDLLGPRQPHPLLLPQRAHAKRHHAHIQDGSPQDTHPGIPELLRRK